jgi:hypothetical protein
MNQVVESSKRVFVCAQEDTRFARAADVVLPLLGSRGANASSQCRFAVLQFDTPSCAVSLAGLGAALSFGSSCDARLLACSDRRSTESVRFGTLGLYLGFAPLDVGALCRLTRDDVAAAFSLQAWLMDDVAMAPGVTVGTSNELGHFVAQMTDAIALLARRVHADGLLSFGAWLLREADRARDVRGRCDADALVRAVAAAFDDELLLGGDRHVHAASGHHVSFDRKAQLLVARLLPYIDALDGVDALDGMCADSTCVAALERLGLIRVEPPSAAADIVQGDLEIELRAAAVVAIRRLLIALNHSSNGSSDSSSSSSDNGAKWLPIDLFDVIHECKELSPDAKHYCAKTTFY